MDRVSQNAIQSKLALSRLLPLILLLFYLTGAIGKLALYGYISFDIQRLVKAVVLIILGGALIVFLKKNRFALYLGVLTVSFLLGQTALGRPITENSILIFAKFLFPIALFAYFSFFKPSLRIQELTFTIFETIMVINSLLILSGFVIELPFLKTYMGDRFGYSGLLESSSVASFVYLTAIYYFLVFRKGTIWKNWIFWLTLFAALMIGTKVVYLGIFVTVAGSILLGHYKYKLPSLIVSMSLFIGLLYFVFLHVNYFDKLALNKGILTAISSKRDLLLLNNTLPYINTNWKVVNYLFGGVSNYDLRSQIGVFDLVFFWGIVGAIVYSCFFIRSYFTFRINKFILLYLLTIGILGLLAGNFFTYSTIMIYLVVFRERIRYEQLNQGSVKNQKIRNVKSFSGNNNKIDILKTSIHNLTMQETLDRVQAAIEDETQLHHVVVNAGKIVAMQKDDELRNSVNSSDLINADGQAVVWASKFLNKPLKERVAGIDLMAEAIKLAHQRKYKIFLFGAKQEIVQEVVRIYKNAYSPDLIAGYRNGYFKKEEEDEIALEIASSGANMLFVAISSPTKENFLFTQRSVLKNVNFIMGVGGSFDVVAGKTKRAPRWMQKAGLEWFYRFLQEPRRMWKRYLLGNSKFIVLVLKEKFGKRAR